MKIITDIEEMKHNIELVKDKVHGLNMTDNQSSVMRLSSLAGCVIINQLGGVPILQMTGRDRNRIALQSDLISASVLGIDTVLCLTGDHITLETQVDHMGADLNINLYYIRNPGRLKKNEPEGQHKQSNNFS